MMYCVIETPVKSSWHDSVEVFLLKGGINETGWRRNGMMKGLRWTANKGGVTCESEDANHKRRQWISSSGRGQNRMSVAKSNTRLLIPSSELRSEAQEYKMTAAMSHDTHSAIHGRIKVWRAPYLAILGSPPMISSLVKQSECEGVMRSLPLNILPIELLSCTVLWTLRCQFWQNFCQ